MVARSKWFQKCLIGLTKLFVSRVSIIFCCWNNQISDETTKQFSQCIQNLFQNFHTGGNFFVTIQNKLVSPVILFGCTNQMVQKYNFVSPTKPFDSYTAMRFCSFDNQILYGTLDIFLSVFKASFEISTQEAMVPLTKQNKFVTSIKLFGSPKQIVQRENVVTPTNFLLAL